MNETPKCVCDTPDDETHAFAVGIPLYYFLVHKPSIEEYENEEIPHTITSADELEWGPSEADFDEQEESITDFRGHVVDRESIARGRRLVSAVSHSCIDNNAIVHRRRQLQSVTPIQFDGVQGWSREGQPFYHRR